MILCSTKQFQSYLDSFPINEHYVKKNWQLKYHNVYLPTSDNKFYITQNDKNYSNFYPEESK